MHTCHDTSLGPFDDGDQERTLVRRYIPSFLPLHRTCIVVAGWQLSKVSLSRARPLTLPNQGVARENAVVVWRFATGLICQTFMRTDIDFLEISFALPPERLKSGSIGGNADALEQQKTPPTILFTMTCNSCCIREAGRGHSRPAGQTNSLCIVRKAKGNWLLIARYNTHVSVQLQSPSSTSSASWMSSVSTRTRTPAATAT